MGLDNPIHIAFLLILLLLVFGAKRLPEMGKSLGTGMRGFKEALSGEVEHASLLAHHQHDAAGVASTAGESPVQAAAPPVQAAAPLQPVPVAVPPAGEQIPA
jgi:sec-independent protein translocase protein TatA